MVVVMMMAAYLYYDLSTAVEREVGLLLSGESYWKAEARREIEDAVSEVSDVKKMTSLDRWVRKMLGEQKKRGYGRSCRRI